MAGDAGDGGAPRFVHLLGKEARRGILLVLLESRSYRMLAAELGVTPAAVAKYVRGETHPSDRVLAKALKTAEPDELDDIADIIVRDLVSGLEDLVEWVIENELDSSTLESELQRLLSRLKIAGVQRGRRGLRIV